MNQRPITALTEALGEVYGEQVRDGTWVLLSGVQPSHWEFGGEAQT
ncbi:tautomerase family protein [Mycobacterium barrassiae]|nr:tautomerase family protein [Mycobacterium barrassiae]